jgi:hypothetical protein
MFVLVAWHPAAVMLARTQDDMDGVEDPAVVVVGARPQRGRPPICHRITELVGSITRLLIRKSVAS